MATTPQPYAKTWMFTLNNPTMSPQEFLETVKTWESVHYVIFQHERGENGTPHFQGYIEFEKRKRVSQLKQLDNRAHWEARRGSQRQAIAYCSKADTRIDGPFEYGDKPSLQGKRTDLDAAIETLKEGGLKRCRESHPNEFVKYGRGLRDLDISNVRQSGTAPDVILLFGPPGVGKTRTFYDAEGDDGVSIIASAGFWFDGYEGQDAVLLDDFDGRASRWPLAGALRVFDRYQVTLPVKGSFIRWKPKRIYVTTNIHPRYWYDWSSREHQYPALSRRFTQVKWWKHEKQAAPQEVTPGTPEWEYFWKGPQVVPTFPAEAFDF